MRNAVQTVMEASIGAAPEGLPKIIRSVFSYFYAEPGKSEAWSQRLDIPSLV
jgi:hypothetical protein